MVEAGSVPRSREVPIHNNFLERQIKQYALGRKLWMFCYDKVGAQASANLFSLVMTARANGVEPFEYLSDLFEQLPSATTVEAIEALLPWDLKLVLDARRKQPGPCRRSLSPERPASRLTAYGRGSSTACPGRGCTGVVAFVRVIANSPIVFTPITPSVPT